MCRRLLGLRKRLTELNEEIDIAEAQLSTLNNDVEYKRKEKEIDKLCCRYDETKAKIQEIEAQPSINTSTKTSVKSSFNKEIRKKIIFLDYCKSRQYFDEILKKFTESVGAAALLLNGAYRLQGDIMSQYIEDTLAAQSSDCQVFPIAFAPGEKDREALLYKILGHLGESEPATPEQAIAKICQSLQLGSIRVFKIHNLDDLQDSYAVLKWFLDCFWLPLIERCQSHCQQENLVNVKLFSLIACQANDPEVLQQPYYAECNIYDPCNVCREKSLVHLPLFFWTEEEIKKWMCSSCPPPKFSKNRRAVDDLARRFYRRTEGVPVNVVDLILEEYQKMEAG
ncbi:MAG: hypothetical protein JJU32_05445 [Phormidium sp. BM_Day4_Bin.17]|nr:hypothetical protein [Phormidium sp. BM_Day4_Bin.17]UCJ12783.1 MAG: hypothetical protein JWS08_02945 [Phormidium sp. PBR-2020]